MPLLSIQNCQALIADHFSLSIETLNINAKQHTVIVGENGSGKSALAALIAGEGELLTGQRNIDAKIAWVCVEQQQALIEAEKQKDCADILDIIPTPTSCEAILFADLEQSAIDQQLIQKVNNTFGLTKLMPRAFRALSTGETKKLAEA